MVKANELNESLRIRSGIGTFPCFLHNQPLLDPDTQGLTLDFHEVFPFRVIFDADSPRELLPHQRQSSHPLPLPIPLDAARERLSITIERRPRVYRLVRNSNQLYAVGTRRRRLGRPSQPRYTESN